MTTERTAKARQQNKCPADSLLPDINGRRLIWQQIKNINQVPYNMVCNHIQNRKASYKINYAVSFAQDKVPFKSSNLKPRCNLHPGFIINNYFYLSRLFPQFAQNLFSLGFASPHSVQKLQSLSSAIFWRSSRISSLSSSTWEHKSLGSPSRSAPALNSL